MCVCVCVCVCVSSSLSALTTMPLGHIVQVYKVKMAKMIKIPSEHLTFGIQRRLNIDATSNDVVLTLMRRSVKAICSLESKNNFLAL